jgi:serine protease
MKTILLSTILTICLSINAFSICNKPITQEFNDAGYYRPAFGEKGTALRNVLNRVIKNHTVQTYKCVWEILKYSDEDQDNPRNIIALYTQRSIPKSRRDDGRNDPDSWNREHVWSKSHGFPIKKQHAYTDAHHIRPADRSVNTSRSNLEFEEDGNSHNECRACNRDRDSWFPGNKVKGDVARMMFYMDVRYEGDDSGTPDLKLVDYITRRSNPQDEKFGRLCILFKWHHEDPVSDFEIRRNNRVYEWQGNRNPFIDHPEWVDDIWKSQCRN